MIPIGGLSKGFRLVSSKYPWLGFMTGPKDSTRGAHTLMSIRQSKYFWLTDPATGEGDYGPCLQPQQIDASARARLRSRLR